MSDQGPRSSAPGSGAVVVFGAAGGIGSRLCERLLERGRTVVAVGRTAEKLNALADRLGIETHVVDAADTDAVDEVVDKAIDRHGAVTGVANCVGSLLLKPAHSTSGAEFDEVVRTNLRSAFAVMRAAGRTMVEGGSVVLVSTAAARAGFANHEAIAAAKAGVIGLTLSAAATYGARGVRVNCVAPGLTRTPLAERLLGNEASAKASMAMHVLGRVGEPDDVAGMIDYLLSDQAAWITGQVFGVDGGLATVRPRQRA